MRAFYCPPLVNLLLVHKPDKWLPQSFFNYNSHLRLSAVTFSSIHPPIPKKVQKWHVLPLKIV